MANLFNSTPNYHFSSSPEPDDISLFLNQIEILLHSPPPPPSPAAKPPGHAQIPIPTCDCMENDVDNYDCESEEAEAEMAAAKATPSRSCSKRSRAAQVHNLSEKRRRSRINEKMKALQNLIPNSNKTDKASMLDEAIEYLKQLQLQVQMLTMRNGLSLYPISLPMGTRMAVDDSDNLNMTKAISMDQNISAPVAVTDISRSETSSIQLQQHHFGAFQFPGSSKGIPEEKKVFPCRPLIEDHPHSSLGIQTTSLKGNVCGYGGGDHLLANFVNSGSTNM